MVVKTDKNDDRSAVGALQTISWYLKAIYTDDDKDKIDNVSNDDTEIKADNADLNQGIANGVSMLDKFYKWSKGLGEHPIENLIIDSQNAVLSFFDGIQIFINNIQTQPDNTAQDEELLYTYAKLEDDGKGEDIAEKSTKETKKAIGNRDKYTNVGEYVESDKSDTYVNVDNSDYTTSTKIPVMVGDFCNVATGKLDFLDTNFLTGDKTKKTVKQVGKDKTKTVLKHGKETVWYKINNVVKMIMKLTIYLTAAILIIFLIWHGVHTVFKSIGTSPLSIKQHREALNRFGLAILTLVGSVAIMALCIFGSQELFKLMDVDDSYELPIRVNVKGAYSFSTTPAGYVRYMASTDDWQHTGAKVGYTFLYSVAVILNLAVVGVMAGRIFIMWFISILGPIFAALCAVNNQGMIRFRAWAVLYVSLSAIPVIMCFLNRIMIGAI